ncbi:MAG: RNA 2',3'-cyclic phosphodiesterase [Methanomassiliicoccaceae archaeon]|nr:RNA 2',3'-cyclic phosphodiesterase [Methanomassiliicoccaceae archaeon]
MPHYATTEENTRLFVSMGISKLPAVRDILERLGEIEGISVPRNIHMTLRFLGDVEKEKIKELESRMISLEKYRSFKVSLKGMGVFPNANNPHIIWIGAEIEDPFTDILSDLDRMLEASSINYDKKPFKAHVTVGRIRTPSVEFANLLAEKQELEAGYFICREIFLMSSKLTPRGAVHSVVNSFHLADE